MDVRTVYKSWLFLFPARIGGSVEELKVHKREKFFGSDFEFFTIL
jgi:hypothetical protein